MIEEWEKSFTIRFKRFCDMRRVGMDYILPPKMMKFQKEKYGM
jgi:hypothetical protein